MDTGVQKKARLDSFSALKAATWVSSLSEIPTDISDSVRVGFGIGEGPKDSCYPKQVHGSSLVQADLLSDRERQGVVEGDGIYSVRRVAPVAVRTADCLPILMWGRSGPKEMVMAVHGGWRGLTAGIAAGGVATFSEAGIPPQSLSVLLGPCISSSHFEVGAEVVEAFRSPALGITDDQLGHCISRGRGDRWHGDLATLAFFDLINQGVDPASATVVRECTYTRSDLYPSFRRDGGIRAHIFSWIALSDSQTGTC